jgi:hypothetical protein
VNPEGPVNEIISERMKEYYHEITGMPSQSGEK